jgi:hypothetical protein
MYRNVCRQEIIAKEKIMMHSNKLLYKRMTVISIMLVIAMIHILRMGTYLDGQLYRYYCGYFSDIIIPFGMYYLLCLNDFHFPFLRRWTVKSILVFSIASFTEIMQAFGIPLLGRTFDPIDFVMFGVGVLAAAVVEKQFFERVCQFGAIVYSASTGKVSIDQRKCYGCGICRSMCNKNSIQLIDRDKVPVAMNRW